MHHPPRPIPGGVLGPAGGVHPSHTYTSRVALNPQGCSCGVPAVVAVQMSLYYAPAFFGHLLGRCVRSRAPVALFLQLGLTVVATFAAVWWPFLSPPEATLQVWPQLPRQVPTGVYWQYYLG